MKDGSDYFTLLSARSVALERGNKELAHLIYLEAVAACLEHNAAGKQGGGVVFVGGPAEPNPRGVHGKISWGE